MYKSGRFHGLKAELLVPEERDISLSKRYRRVNAWCCRLGKDNVIVISIHVTGITTYLTPL